MYENMNPSKQVKTSDPRQELPNEQVDIFKSIVYSMVDLYHRKNTDYGDSFHKLFQEFGMTSPIIKLSDKLERIKTLSKQGALVKNESMRDSLVDLANYAILTIMELDDAADRANMNSFNRYD